MTTKPANHFMTKPDTTTHELIQVIPPDYDRRFTYSLKIGDETVFDDDNKLGDNRFQLTDLISKINGKLMRLNNFEREFAGLNPEAVKDVVSILQGLSDFGPLHPNNIGWRDRANAALAALKGSK